MWRAYIGVIHCVFGQIPNLQNCFTNPYKNLGWEGASDSLTRAAKSLYMPILRESRHLGFGVFIVSWSMLDVKENTFTYSTGVRDLSDGSVDRSRN